MAATAAAIAVPLSPNPAATCAVLAGFVLASLAQFHVELRGHTLVVTLSEVPLAFGLVYLDPYTLAAVWTFVTVATISYRHHSSTFKLAVNAAITAAHTAVAAVIVSSASSFETVSGVLILAGALTAAGVTSSSVFVAIITKVSGDWSMPTLKQRAKEQLVLLAGGVSFGVWTVNHYLTHPALVIFPAFGLVTLRAVSASQRTARQRYDDLEATHEITRTLSAVEPEQVRRRSIEATVAAFRASWGALIEHGATVAVTGDVPADPQTAASSITASSGPVTLVVGGRVGVTTVFAPRDTVRLATTADVVAGAISRADMNAALAHQADHDSLTGLLNRDGFARTVETIKPDSGMIVLNVARFREVNATLGHDCGDALLVETGNRISAAASGGVVARIGADTFAVFVDGVSRKTVIDTASRIGEALSEPLDVGHVSMRLGFRTGIAFGIDHGSSCNDLFRSADVAADQARDVQPPVVVYRPAIDTHSAERLSLIYNISCGIENNEFRVVYQPKVHAVTQNIVGCEALLRWDSPTGPVSPTDFIPYAEAGGLMGTLTDFVLDAALSQHVEWRGRGHEVGMAVNLSAAILSDGDLPERVRLCLAKHDVEPAILTLEITESVMVSDRADIRSVLAELRALGIRLSVDDFGTGYSSLQYLKDLEVDELKLDRTFVTDLCISERAETIARAVVTLGHSLGLSVVAEGIETPAAQELLTSMKCDSIQGFLIARPMPADKFYLWMQRRNEGHFSL